MIEEHDHIILTADVPEEGLRAGDVGTVVHVYGQGEAFEVEFITLSGETVAIATVPHARVRPVGKRDITHARSLS